MDVFIDHQSIIINIVENSAIIRNLENIFSTRFLFLRKSN